MSAPKNSSSVWIVAVLTLFQNQSLLSNDQSLVEAVPNPLFKPILSLRKPYYGGNYLGQNGRYGGGGGADDGGGDDYEDGMGNLGGMGTLGQTGIGDGQDTGYGSGMNRLGPMALGIPKSYLHMPPGYGHGFSRHHRHQQLGDGLQSHYHRKRLHHLDEIQHSHNQNQFGSSLSNAAMLGFVPLGHGFGHGFGDMRR